MKTVDKLTVIPKGALSFNDSFTILGSVRGNVGKLRDFFYNRHMRRERIT